MSTYSPVTLTTWGAAGTVTGSRFLLKAGGRSVLIDCGLFQGSRELRDRNWSGMPLDVRDLDAVVITHAHLDHCGYLPRLVSAGYSGPVHVTADTARLMAIVLPDSARLLEEEASYARRAGYSRHDPALPLYTEEDAAKALDLCTVESFGTELTVADGIAVRFDHAGHILGSATLWCTVSEPEVSLRFSGDLGRPDHPLLVPPELPGTPDWLVVESTYGDRLHDDADMSARLADLIRRTVARGGRVVVPAFAVDRTEVLLHELAGLYADGAIPRVPVYVDSPMALAALGVYRTAISEGHDGLRPAIDDADLFRLPELVEVHDAEESKRLTASGEPCIIVAGSGMATGGRVTHHLKKMLPDPRNSVALVGYQAEGTRGRTLLDGEPDLKIHGQYVRVRAEVADVTGFSVHADADELMQWIGACQEPPRGVFVVHGEPQASAALARRISSELDWTAVVPSYGERLLLG
jgi:metallo-beta-lactamase family protein